MTTFETETGLEFGETEFGEVGEFETEQFLDSILGGILGGEVGTSPLSEAEELELASELLEISNEQELEQFLGGLIKKVGGFMKSPVGQALGGVLKNVAKKALPVVGGALGSMVVPGIGTALGSKLGTMASGMFELEFESMPLEQAEFEIARRTVGLTAAAAHTAARARPHPATSPHTVARAAVAHAARTYAPGVHRQMLNSLRTSTSGARPAAGAYSAGAGARPTARPTYGGARPAAGGGYRPAPSGRPGAAGRPRYPTTGGYGAPYAAPYGVPYGVPEPYPAEPVPDYLPPEEPAAAWDGATTDGFGVAASGRWVRRGRRIILLGA
jgi:uncharacterized protein (DUF697 family)